MLTVRMLEEDVPITPFAVLTSPEKFWYEPAVSDFTLAVTVQLAPKPSTPLVRVIEVEVELIVPPHWEELGVPARTIPLGKLSVNVIPVNCV